MGRRGKPVKKLRLIPAEKAFALAFHLSSPAWPGALGVEQRAETLTQPSSSSLLRKG